MARFVKETIMSLSFCACMVLYVATIVTARGVVPQSDDRLSSFECIDKQGLYQVGDVPNPSPLNCSMYYTCAPAGPNSSHPVAPIARPCQEGPEGLLFYDFRSCQCDNYPDRCYDRDLSADYDDFFKCTDPYDPEVHGPSTVRSG